MKRPSSRDLAMALYAQGDLGARTEALRHLVIDLLVEVEALRSALTQLQVGGAGPSVHSGFDIPCHDDTLVAGKAAYPAAYIDAAYVLHNAAGPTAGVEKLLARFYPPDTNEPREALMLHRLGFSDSEVDKFVIAATQAEFFS